MSSEVITRNDLKAILDEVLPSPPTKQNAILGDITFTKTNGDNVVNVSGWGNATISSSAYTSIGTLPEEFRPTDTRFVSALCGNAITYNAIMRILPSGDVSLLSETSITNQFFAIGGSYIIV